MAFAILIRLGAKQIRFLRKSLGARLAADARSLKVVFKLFCKALLKCLFLYFMSRTKLFGPSTPTGYTTSPNFPRRRSFEILRILKTTSLYHNRRLSGSSVLQKYVRYHKTKSAEKYEKFIKCKCRYNFKSYLK